MTGRFTTLRSLLAKDLQLLWQLVLLNAGLFLALTLTPAEFVQTRQLTGTLSNLAAALLIVAVIHLDSPSDLTLDWLTRPIARGTLLAEKFLFLFVVLFVPSLLCQAIPDLLSGEVLGTALRQAALDHLILLSIALPLMAIAAVTRTLVGAGALALGLLLLGIVIFQLSWFLAGQPAEDSLPLAQVWPFLQRLFVVEIVGSLTVLWLQYVPKRAGLARAAFVATLIALAAMRVGFLLSLPSPAN